MRRMRRGVTAAATVACLAASTACSSVLTGTGSASTTAAPGSSGAAPANRFARTPVSTAVGDPVTLDFCAAIEAAATQGTGYTGRFADTQYVPGCSTTVVPVGSSSHLTASTFVALGNVPSNGVGRTTTQVSGLTVYRFPYDAAGGNCERDVVASGITVKVSAYARRGSGQPSQTVTCAVTTAIVARLAPAMASRSLPALSTASPSLTSLDGCAIARAADLTSLSALAGAKYSPDDAGVGCGMVGTVSFYIDPVITTKSQPDDGEPEQVGRHKVWAGSSNGTSICAYTSMQGRTGSGRYEALEAVASPSGTGDLPDGTCSQIREALVRYLDTAGLT